MEALYPSFNNPRGINPCYDDPNEQDKYARCNKNGLYTYCQGKGSKQEEGPVSSCTQEQSHPVITQIGISFAGGIGGAIVTENIFAIPGIGVMLVNAVKSRDVPVVMGVIIFVTIIVGVVNLIVELICAMVEPRIDFAS